MDKINKPTTQNRNNITQQTNTAYQNSKRVYADYIKQTNNSDFANSPRRYIIELNFIKNLQKLALSEKNQTEYEKWNKRETEIKEKLNEWGIQINKED